MRFVRWRQLVCGSILAVLAAGGSASAQITPAAGYVPPDDTPSIRVGATIFTDYTYTKSPESTDTDGNSYNPSAFNVARSYINITGNISHIVAFRITPDITRDTDATSSINGNLVFRIKYAFATFNTDEWVGRGSYVRLGIQQTPWIDYAEGIYRYRFQGTTFVEREGYFASADAGVSYHYQIPSNYGDIHVGIFNGENYNRAETNGQKATMIRGSFRPFAGSSTTALRGFRVNGFYDSDHYVKDGDRTRGIFTVTFEHPYLNAAYEYLDAADQTSITKAKVNSHGYSIWATPRTSKGWEGLLRYDHLTPDDSIDRQTRQRTIVGVAYWFPHQGNVSSSLLLDYDGQSFDNFVPALPKQQRIALHALINF